MAIPFVGKRFTPDELAAYLTQVQFSSFTPRFVTLHHTGAPNLAQRPNGFSAQHLQNLLHYYQNELGWRGAPHLFIDDRPQPIIVFQRLDRRGVHAVSFNKNSWGIEMLGNYDTEPFNQGRGAVVRDNAIEALTRMCVRLGVAADTIKFHRDDPTTRKTCPGNRVSKADIVARVAARLQQPIPPDSGGEAFGEWKVVLPGGGAHVPVHTVDGRPTVRVRAFLTALGEGGALELVRNKTVVRWTRGDGSVEELPVAELDSAGTAWSLVRTLAEAAGRTLDVDGRTVTVG